MNGMLCTCQLTEPTRQLYQALYWRRNDDIIRRLDGTL